MENISKMAIDDSSSSMYFSFNNTTAYKMQLEVANDNSIPANDENECDQNDTLEADDANQPIEQVQTVKKLSFGVSPAKAIPKNILKAYNVLSSTPTKAQLLRSVEFNRGSAAVDVDDLGLAFLEAPQESIKSVLTEEKENQPQESQEIVFSETSSEIVVSVIEKTQEEEKPVKKVGFSNLPILKNSGNSNIQGGTPNVRRSFARHEPDLARNRPSRINKRVSIAQNTRNLAHFQSSADEIPKMLSSILKISKGLPKKRQSITNIDNPFNLLGRATRMSIVKTTLNSPARKVSRKSMNSVQIGKISTSICNLPVNKAKSIGRSSPPKRVIPTNIRKSMIPSNATSPKKATIVPSNARKSMIASRSSTWLQNPRKSMSTKTSNVSISGPPKNQTTSGGSKDDFTCEFCSRKFFVLSLFETHKRTHNKIPSSTKTSAAFDNKCRYCDKKFAIAKALANHLIQNCTKIPPGDKKKLLFPTDQPIATHSKAKLPSKLLSNASSCDSFPSSTQLSRSQLNAKKLTDGNISMAPQSSNNKLKKKLAHSGVYCTPNKQIMCHICKTSFSNILAFTEHKKTHSNAANAVGDSDGA
ncbi:uncharacterized protein LOC129939844 [Eupeodes corollae]|uniref:uncharacterized protein LOC129939844 n=1 Tax=Eupeodes corollae TaxID=290404 RepID=UPI00249375FF|nr:uncharacterized protein LOC129939844 [Eupeodes corollae]